MSARWLRPTNPLRLLPNAPLRDRGEDDDPGGSSRKGPLAKRNKVTAVACVACQKRKCKCDGMRPVCTACQIKRTDCVYDSASDLRRTAALKQRIEALEGGIAALESENEDLRDIIRSLCAAASTPNFEPILRVVRSARSDRGIGELAQLLRMHVPVHRDSPHFGGAAAEPVSYAGREMLRSPYAAAVPGPPQMTFALPRNTAGDAREDAEVMYDRATGVDSLSSQQQRASDGSWPYLADRHGRLRDGHGQQEPGSGGYF